MDASTASAEIDSVGRIPKRAAEASGIVVFVLAIVTVIACTAFRLRQRKLRWLDDGFLIGGAMLMTAVFGLFVGMLDGLYVTEAAVYDLTAVLSIYTVDEATAIALRVTLFTAVYTILSSAAVYCAKLSLLFSLGPMVHSNRPAKIYWRVVTVYTAVAGLFSIGFSVYACPYVDDRALQCGQGSELAQSLNTTIVLVVLDVLANTLIISVAAMAFKQSKAMSAGWRSRLYTTWLICFTAGVLVIIVLQAASATYSSFVAIDIIWEVYFGFLELTLTVMLVSTLFFLSPLRTSGAPPQRTDTGDAG